MANLVLDEYETDSVTIRTEKTPIKVGIRPLHDCEERKAEYRTVGVQTTEIAKKRLDLPIVPSCDESDAILVTRNHLESMRRYYFAVKSAYFNYSASNGDSVAVIKNLFEQTPEILSMVNRQGQTPIEAALVQRKWKAAAQLLELAARKNPKALLHRTSDGDDVLMLAVAGGSEAIVKQLLDLQCGRFACFHYNAIGRNSLHLCGLGSSNKILDLIFDALADLLNRRQLAPECVTAALCTSDCDGSSPLHYMARDNQSLMLKAVHEFSLQHNLLFDWDLRQTAGNRLTPLALAARVEAIDACRFLLQKGLVGIDLHDHIDLWLYEPLSDSIRSMLGKHCSLLEPINALPPENLSKLQDGLRERGLTDEFLLQLRTQWSDLPQLPTVTAVLIVSQNYCSSSRLAAWDILVGLGAADLAQFLEG